MSRTSVFISVSSVQEDGGLREGTRREHRGTFHERAGVAYLVYEDDEACTTTLRLGTDEVRLYRRGALNAWQDFRCGEWTGGLFALGAGRQGQMVLRVLTRELCWTHTPQGGQLALVYDLYTAESADADADPTGLSLGRFTLDLAWTALPSSTPEGTR
ncbi:MAG: DUF1934 domain-containing protein [Candidatus Sericytochromatia bacterium]|nr:DUF1934 domain-containing protein [Candidatus Sericytochromatia bacterium]